MKCQRAMPSGSRLTQNAPESNHRTKSRHGIEHQSCRAHCSLSSSGRWAGPSWWAQMSAEDGFKRTGKSKKHKHCGSSSLGLMWCNILALLSRLTTCCCSSQLLSVCLACCMPTLVLLANTVSCRFEIPARQTSLMTSLI